MRFINHNAGFSADNMAEISDVCFGMRFTPKIISESLAKRNITLKKSSIMLGSKILTFDKISGLLLGPYVWVKRFLVFIRRSWYASHFL